MGHTEANKSTLSSFKSFAQKITWQQVVVSVAASLGTGGSGFGNAWSSYSLPDLSDCENNPQKPEGCTFDEEFTSEEASWIGSMYSLGQIFSLPIAGVIMSMSPSRKLALFLLSLIYLVGWTFLALAEPLTLDEIYWFYIGRFIIGLGAGAIGLVGVLYIHESVEPMVRGGLGNFPVFIHVLAYCIGTLFGALMPWYIATYIGYFLPVCQILVLPFIPETPFSLVHAGKNDKAREAIKWLNRKDFDVEVELVRLEGELDEVNSIGRAGLLEILTKGVYLKPLLVMLGFMFFVYFTGLTGVSMYMTDIFIKAGFDEDKSLFYSTAVSSAQVVGTIVSILVVDKMGRRPVLVLSSTGLLITMTALATFFYYDDNVEVICPDARNTTGTTTTTLEPCLPKDGFEEDFVDSLAWMPLTSLFLYKFSHSFGLTPLSNMMMGEFFASEAKDTSSAITFMLGNLCSFLVSKYQVNIENAFGTAGLYYFYASWALISIFYCWFIIPETKGRSAKDMKRLYNNDFDDSKDAQNYCSRAMNFSRCCRKKHNTESLQSLHVHIVSKH